MNKRMKESMFICPHCKGQLNSWFNGNFEGRFFDAKLNALRIRYFCKEACYRDYVKNFVAEIYNSEPIYCVKMTNGEKRYMPYFEADYYFADIDNCKRRMDMKHVAVINSGIIEI